MKFVNDSGICNNGGEINKIVGVHITPTFIKCQTGVFGNVMFF